MEALLEVQLGQGQENPKALRLQPESGTFLLVFSPSDLWGQSFLRMATLENSCFHGDRARYPGSKWEVGGGKTGVGARARLPLPQQLQARALTPLSLET